MQIAVRLSALAFVAAVAGLWFCVAAAAQDSAAPAPGKCYAVILGAMPGEEVYARHYRDWIKRFHAYMVQSAGVPAANVVVLSGDKDFKDPIVAGLATIESVRKAMAEMTAKVKPEDQFILCLVGHGVVTEKTPTLVLPGPDIDAQELADDMAAMAARNQVVLNFSSASGTAMPVFARKDRVVVAATGPMEGNEPVFPEFFLRGLESKRADGEGAPAAGAKDGRVTVLEAFNWAAREAALWIVRIRKAGVAWKVDGKESVEVFEKLYRDPPGTAGTQKLASGSDRSAPDAPVTIKPPGGKIDSTWVGRRVLSEHAVLEDCGEKNGVSAIGDKGYEPLSGARPGEPGSLARRVCIGSADLLPAANNPPVKP